MGEKIEKNIIIKKCPFRKKTIYIAGRNTGSGYPLEWIAEEEFENCIEEKCALFDTVKQYSTTETNYVTIKKCSGQVFSDDFISKLP